MKVFWFIPIHGDGRYLGTAERGLAYTAGPRQPEGKGTGASHARSVIAIQNATCRYQCF